MTYYTYMIRCEDDSYYTGYTTDPIARFNKHASGKGAKYTRSHKPVEFAYLEVFNTKSEAMSREYKIKQLSHEEKETLACKNNFKMFRLLEQLGEKS